MNRPLWNTQNDLAEKVRTGAVELLNQQLADALDLALQAKQAHWNVKGPTFIGSVDKLLWKVEAHGQAKD